MLTRSSAEFACVDGITAHLISAAKPPYVGTFIFLNEEPRMSLSGQVQKHRDASASMANKTRAKETSSENVGNKALQKALLRVKEQTDPASISPHSTHHSYARK